MCFGRAIGWLTFILCALPEFVLAAGENNPDAINFMREIRPLILEKCVECHGPDQQESGLRLDRVELAFQELESGNTAIVPGRPEESELIYRVSAVEADERMPPSGEPLSMAQIDTLRHWIANGATYTKHWAYVKPRHPPDPQVQSTSWPQNSIDRFVLRRLEEEDLQPNPAADRYTLIRRVYLDLIGLPPSVEEVDVFVNDESEGAYEKVVQRLLSSQQFPARCL